MDPHTPFPPDKRTSVRTVIKLHEREQLVAGAPVSLVMFCPIDLTRLDSSRWNDVKYLDVSASDPTISLTYTNLWRVVLR